MTLQEDIEGFIELMETNLQTMGVIDAEFDPETGLIGLANQILNIPPSSVGIDITTSITCSCPSAASVGVPFTITGTLSATYDDISQTNVDLVGGKLQGATIEIYNGETLLGTTTTNEHGEYTYNCTLQTTGTYSIKAVYNSLNDYYENSASSSTSMTVIVLVSSLTLITNKNELSYSNQESTTLTITALDENNEPATNRIITLDVSDKNNNSIDTLTCTTNSNGIATTSYQPNLTGNINIKATCDNIQSNNISIDVWSWIEDCIGTMSSKWLQVANAYYGTFDNTLCIINSADIIHTCYRNFKLDYYFYSNGGYWDWNRIVLLETNDGEYTWTDTAKGVGVSNSYDYHGTDIGVTYFPKNQWVKMTIIYNRGSLSFYMDDVLKGEVSVNYPNINRFVLGGVGGQIKELKLMEL